MVADSTEQVAAVTAEQENPAPVVADAPVNPSPAYDLSTDDGIRAAIEANPNLSGFITKTKADAENTARQRYDAEVKREQGTVERATQYHQWVTEQIANGADPDEIAKQTPLFVKANEATLRAQLNRMYVEGSRQFFELPESDALSSALEAVGDDPDQSRVIAESVLQAIYTKGGQKAVGELTLDTVPKESRLYEQIQEAIHKETATELRARETERRAVDPGPVTPNGVSTSAMTKEGLDAMDPTARRAYIATLGDAERGALWDLIAPSR